MYVVLRRVLKRALRRNTQGLPPEPQGPKVKRGSLYPENNPATKGNAKVCKCVRMCKWSLLAHARACVRAWCFHVSVHGLPCQWHPFQAFLWTIAIVGTASPAPNRTNVRHSSGRMMLCPPVCVCICATGCHSIRGDPLVMRARERLLESKTPACRGAHITQAHVHACAKCGRAARKATTRRPRSNLLSP